MKKKPIEAKCRSCRCYPGENEAGLLDRTTGIYQRCNRGKWISRSLYLAGCPEWEAKLP